MVRVSNSFGLKVLYNEDDTTRQAGECTTRRITEEEREKYGYIKPVNTTFIHFGNKDYFKKKRQTWEDILIRVTKEDVEKCVEEYGLSTEAIKKVSGLLDIPGATYKKLVVYYGITKRKKQKKKPGKVSKRKAG